MAAPGLEPQRGRTSMSAKMTRREFSSGAVASLLSAGCRTGGIEGHRCPPWEPGGLDIHFIHTGVGEQTFFIFPDGTTMLLDCGDTHHAKYMRDVPPQPGAERCGGEWVSRYIQRLIPQREIDYLMVSHWHGDHIGDPSLGCWKNAKGGQVCGISAVAEDFTFRDYFDHQYPNAGQYALDPDPEAFAHFQSWLKGAVSRGMRPHRFAVGARDQICMRHAPSAYPTFHVRNLAANAVLWDGKDGVIDCGAAHVKGGGGGQIHENRLSSAIRIDYGRFSYYTGGDAELTLKDAQGREYNWEAAIGRVCGPVDVAKTNHHAGPWGMSAGFCREIRAQAYLSSVWQARMVDRKSLDAMCSRELYPGDRIVFFGYVADKAKSVAESFGRDIAPAGHAVVKVAPGGDAFRIYTFDASDESMRVLSVRAFVSRQCDLEAR